MPFLQKEYWMIRSTSPSDYSDEGEPSYKAAAGTAGATPKLYRSEAQAKAAVKGDMHKWDVVRVEIKTY